MYIKKAELTNFGKFHQKTISFSPGLNVVYGENESGKSTLHSFLVAMLFGLEKQRGRAGKADRYQRCEPWNAAAYYAGSLEFAVTGGRDAVGGSGAAGYEKEFRIERNFYHKEKTARLFSLNDGEELSIEHGDLDILLGDVGKGLYENTYCIAQAAVVTEADFVALLRRELVNSMYGGDGGIDVSMAQRTLEDRRRKEEQKLKLEQQRRRERQERLTWEQEVLLSDIRQLEEKLAGLERDPDAEKSTETERREEAERLSETERKGGAEKTAGDCGRREGILWRIPVIGWILRLFRWIFRRRKGNSNTTADVEARDSIAGTGHGGTSIHTIAAARNLLTEQLAEKRTRLYNLSEEMEEVSGTTKTERAIETELKSIRLAYEVLERTARDSYQSNRDGIQAAVSGIFSGITGGRYDDLMVTENGQVTVCKEGRRLEPWQLSRGAMEQLYLALRLGVGRCLMKEEPMPVLLDETFCAYDDRRLARTLRWLAGQQDQVILFTCQKREMELLEQQGVEYSKILL